MKLRSVTLWTGLAAVLMGGGGAVLGFLGGAIAVGTVAASVAAAAATYLAVALVLGRIPLRPISIGRMTLLWSFALAVSLLFLAGVLATSRDSGRAVGIILIVFILSWAASTTLIVKRRKAVDTAKS